MYLFDQIKIQYLMLLEKRFIYNRVFNVFNVYFNFYMNMSKKI